MVPNSAAQERLFSSLGNIQTKKRSKLKTKRTFELARVKASLPVPKRAPLHFEIGKYLLRSVSSSVDDTATESVDAAVDATAAQLADSDTLRGEEDVDAVQEQLEKEVRSSQGCSD